MPAPIVGVQIVPTMPVTELIETIRVAERIGYSHAMIADEGLMHDVYATLGAAALATGTIRLGAVTNPYTRHPAATAAALGTVDELSSGRAFVTLVAGGTMVLHPMGIERRSPVAMIDDTIEVCRRLWTGETVSWTGHKHELHEAALSTGRHDIPIWVAARGERVLELAGRKADGVVLMAKSDLGQATGLATASGRDVSAIYLDRLAFTPEMVEEAKALYAYAILDSPPRMLANLGIDDATVGAMRDAFASSGPEGVAPLVTDEMVSAYQIAGTRHSCRTQLGELMSSHSLDGFALNIISPGLAENTALMEDVMEIVMGAADV